MAESKGNVITHGLSGKVGDLVVFRRKGNRTFVSKKPEQPKGATEKQAAHRLRFRHATLYAKAATEDLESKVVYSELAAKRKRTPFIVAVADFLNAPEIETIDVSKYFGATDDIIKVMVADDAMVKSVYICIENADGTIVEEGDAVADASGYVWTYTAVQNNDSLDGDKITVSVSDLPGNVVEESVTIN
jgi:hypothetical protein